VAAIVFVSLSKKTEDKQPEAIQKIQDVFEKEIQKDSSDYDLQETIRIIHGLEIAQKESKSFDEFFEFLARQDYGKVAPDIVEAKAKLLPILSKLYKAEEDLEQVQKTWDTFSKLSGVLVDDGSKLTASYASGGFNQKTVTSFIDMGLNSIAVIKNQNDIESSVKEAISDIREDYIKYLEFYTPIYLKYMEQWDRVCIYRDAAYLQIHGGQTESAIISLDQTLSIYSDDMESKLLKSFCLILLEDKERNEIDGQEKIKRDFLTEAKEILDDYINRYPNKTAPALLLLGSYYMLKGDEAKALNYYNQSSAEYPKQSIYLLDMLNSYKQRSYLGKTAEGMYIIKIYKSIMEGFGFFSPNFQKALIAHDQNNYQRSKEEILQHFFRRGNQDIYDYLVSDMSHCETYLPESFNMIFKEKSFLDLIATPTFLDSKKLNIKVKNRSDIKLSNVRIFLCLHFTDMFKDDYEVIKVNTTINNIEAYTTADFGDVEIDFSIYGKEKNSIEDIVSARAIIITDDLISWIDQNDFKINYLKNSFDRFSENKSSLQNLEKQLLALGMKKEEFYNSVMNNTSVKVKRSIIGKDQLEIKLPRMLVHFNPYFSINEISLKESVLPSSVSLNGPDIEVIFNYNISPNGELGLYMTSEKLKILWKIYSDKNGNISKILINYL